MVSFIVSMRSEDVYADLTRDNQTKFNTLNHEVDRPQSTGNTKK